MSDAHEDVRLLLGGYVLGGLADPDLARVQDHLPTCPACRDELATLAALPGLLRRRPPHQPDLPAPPVLLPALLAEVDAQRRRARRRGGLRLAAAAVTVAALTAGGSALLTRDATRDLKRDTLTQGPQARFIAAAGTATGGNVQLVAKPWGTALTVTLSGLPRSGRFVLQATGRDGAREQAAAWGATTNGMVKVVGATSLTPGDVTSVSVVGADGRAVASASPSR